MPGGDPGTIDTEAEVRVSQSFVEVIHSPVEATDADKQRVTQAFAQVVASSFTSAEIDKHRVTQVFAQVIHSIVEATSSITGDLDAVEDADTAEMFGDGVFVGDLAATETADTAHLYGINAGDLDAVEDPDTTYMGINSGYFALTETPDTMESINPRRHYVSVAIVSEDQ